MGTRNRIGRLAMVGLVMGSFWGTARAGILLPPPVDLSFSGNISDLTSGITLSDAVITYANYLLGTLQQVWVIPATLTPDGDGYSYATPAVSLPVFGVNMVSLVAQYTDSACPSGSSGCGVFLAINNNWLSTGSGPLVAAYGADPGGSTFAYGNSFEELTGINEDVFKSQLGTAYARATGASPTYFLGSDTPQLGDYIAGDVGGSADLDDAIDQSMGDGLEVAAAGAVATGGAVSNLTQAATIDYSVQAPSGTQTTPEPSSLFLLASSLAAVALLRLRYRNWRRAWRF